MIDMELSGLSGSAAATLQVEKTNDANGSDNNIRSLRSGGGIGVGGAAGDADGGGADTGVGDDDTNSEEGPSRMEKIQKFIANVFEITSIHGVAYLTKEGTHAIER